MQSDIQDWYCDLEDVDRQGIAEDPALRESGKACPDPLSWKALSSEVLSDCEIFLVRRTLSESNCGQNKQKRFHTLSCRNWVTVIALSDDNKVLIAEQFRHGVSDLTLEIPGGMIDETDGSPEIAAKRELREETGYVSDKWSFLGATHPNPALQDNLCYVYLAEAVRKIEEPLFDGTGTERIRSHSLSMHEIKELIRKGLITHSLVITAFHFLMLQRPELFN